jgi:hypothetical protein
LREYVAGDELRHVHWRASAKAGQLLVREYVDPVQAQCTVVLDTRASALDADAFEEAVEVAASVVWAAAAAGHRTTLVTADGARDRGTATGALDRLAGVAQGDEQDLVRALDLVARGERGGWLVLVSGAVEAAVLSSVTALRSGFAPLTLFDVSGWPERPEVPGVLVVRERTAAGAITAWNGRPA